MPIYIVKPRPGPQTVDMEPRLIKAERVTQVEAHLLKEFEISKADAEQAAELAGCGVKVETAAP